MLTCTRLFITKYKKCKRFLIIKFWCQHLNLYEKESFSSHPKANVSHLWHGAPLEHSLTYNGLWPTSGFFLVCLWTHSRSARLQKVWTIKDLLDGLINTVFLWETMGYPRQATHLGACQTINYVVIPPNSNMFSDWKRTSCVKIH